MPEHIHESNTKIAPSAASPDLARVQTLVRRSLRGACRRMRVTLDAASFEDLEQETLVLAWSRRETCVDPARFDAWIYGIARRRILKHLERMQADRRRLIPFPALSPDAHPEVTPEPADTAFGRQVRENVAGCGTSVVAIAIAHAVDGQSFRAIAERLHQKETTVKNRYYRQLPELRRRLAGCWKALTGLDG
ncbi:MAG: RNA polymerase sigma factor [Planctomycetota bacterium]